MSILIDVGASTLALLVLDSEHTPCSLVSYVSIYVIAYEIFSKFEVCMKSTFV